MDKLEQLLQNPASHSDVPSSELVRKWSEQALERWALENQNGALVVNPKVERVKELVFGLGLTACLVFLGLILFDSLSSALGGYDLQNLNLPTSTDLQLMFQTYSTWIAVAACAVAILATRPIREFLLDELG